jgi:tight adherence protein C
MESAMVMIAVGASFLAILTAALFIMLSARERSEVRAALRQLEDYQIENLREQEMLASASDRLVAPIMGALNRLSLRFTPSGYVDQVRHKLVLAGNPPSMDADRFMAFKVIGALSGPFWFWFVPWGIGLRLMSVKGIVAFVFLWGASFMLADILTKRKIDARQKAIARAMPDVLDLLVISVEAGLGFEQAIDRTVASVPGPLSEELRRMLQEMRVGASRADSLRAMDARTEVAELRAFVLAILQADTFGVSIGRVLRTQAEEMRIKRRQRAQELAMAAPVKMLFPMLFCIFPALFVIILGPAAMDISQNL